MHNLDLKQLHIKQLEVRECIKAELRTHIQIAMCIFDNCNDLNNTPDKKHISEAKKSLKCIHQYIEEIA